ncbi:MAG: Uma2 family endonuclease [Acidobacteria bacterium]|nr:Uma2 family endonuclease [Acidobacteriota bacterium]
MSALSIPRISVEEYLAADRAAERRSEYHDGEVFPMVAVTFTHARLAVSLARRLDEKLSYGTCQTLAAPRVRARATNFVYPDLAVICGQPQLGDAHGDILLNPRVIIEILSPSTADYDYGGKFALYRGLASLEEYVLVSQESCLIEVFRRLTDGRWALSSYQGAEAVLTLECLGIALPLAEIYAGVELPAA